MKELPLLQCQLILSIMIIVLQFKFTFVLLLKSVHIWSFFVTFKLLLIPSTQKKCLAKVSVFGSSQKVFHLTGGIFSTRLPDPGKLWKSHCFQYMDSTVSIFLTFSIFLTVSILSRISIFSTVSIFFTVLRISIFSTISIFSKFSTVSIFSRISMFLLIFKRVKSITYFKSTLLSPLNTVRTVK